MDEEGVEYVRNPYQLDTPIRFKIANTEEYKGVFTCPRCESWMSYTRDYLHMCLHCDQVLEVNTYLIVYNKLVRFFYDYRVNEVDIAESFRILHIIGIPLSKAIRLIFKCLGIKEEMALEFVKECNKKIGECFGNDVEY